MTTVNVLELSLFLKMDINRYNLKILSVMIFTVQKVFFFHCYQKIPKPLLCILSFIIFLSGDLITLKLQTLLKSFYSLVILLHLKFLVFQILKHAFSLGAKPLPTGQLLRGKGQKILDITIIHDLLYDRNRLSVIKFSGRESKLGKTYTSKEDLCRC